MRGVLLFAVTGCIAGLSGGSGDTTLDADAALGRTSSRAALTGQQAPEALIVARNGDLYATSLAGDRTVRLTRTSAWESSATVSPDGSVVAYERSPKRSDPPELWTMRV